MTGKSEIAEGWSNRLGRRSQQMQRFCFKRRRGGNSVSPRRACRGAGSRKRGTRDRVGKKF